MLRYSLKISSAGIEFIKKHQGLSLEKYRDENGLWVIGYGHVITGADDFGDSISPALADKLLADDLAACEKKLQQIITCPLTPLQHDALISLIFSDSALPFITAQMPGGKPGITERHQATRV